MSVITNGTGNLLDFIGSGNTQNVQFLLQDHSVLGSSTLTSCLPKATEHHDGYTTVYTTEYVQVCPTEKPCPKGTKTATYTITETCSGDEHDYTRPAIPSDFTTVVTICDACAGKPTITVTGPSKPVKTVVSPVCPGGPYCPPVPSVPGGGAGNGGAGNGGAGNGGPGNGGAGNGGAGNGGAGNNNGGNANGGYAPPDTNKGNNGNGAVPPPKTAGPPAGTNNGYIQASMATTGKAEVISMVLGGLVGLVAWLL